MDKNGIDKGHYYLNDESKFEEEYSKGIRELKRRKVSIICLFEEKLKNEISHRYREKENYKKNMIYKESCSNYKNRKKYFILKIKYITK